MNYKNTTPVFRLKPLSNTNNCIVKHVGYLNDNEKLADEPLDIETTDNMINSYGKNVFFIDTINDYEITVYVLKCNILGNYLLNNIKMPIYNLCFMYKNKLINGYLFNVYINFTLNQSCKNNLIKPQHYINATLTGNYSIDIDCDQSIVDKRIDFILSLQDIVLKQIINKFMLSYDNINLFMNDITNEYNQTMSDINIYYDKLFDGFQLLNFPSEQIILSLYSSIYKNPFIKYLIHFSLLEREKERRINLGVHDDDTYFIPQKIIKIKDVLLNPTIVDDLLNIDID